MAVPSRVSVPLSGPVAEALRDLSRREFRHPRDQAAKLVVEGLRQAGALADDATGCLSSAEPASAG